MDLQSLSYYRWLIFGVTVTGTFMGTLDASIVNVALPFIALQLNTPLVTTQWVVTAYLLTVSCLLPLFGRAGDMLGRRNVFSAGFLIFTLGSALCGFAANISMLITARIIQAIGAGMIMANGQALVAAAFPGPERGRALGMVGVAVALGSMTGPSLGGLLVGSFGWSSIFLINLPIGIIGYILGRLILPKQESVRRESFDFGGALLFAIGMLSLLLVLSEGHAWGWSSQPSLCLLASSAAAFAWFVRHEKTVRHPMIHLSLFHNRTFLTGNVAGLLAFMALFSNQLLLPFYLTDILHLTPSQTGLLITPMPLTMAIVAPFSGYLSERLSAARLAATGLVVTVGALLSLAALDGSAPLWQIAACQVLLGAGSGLFQSPNNNSVLSSVAADKLGIASGINALVRNVGMAAGIAAAVAIFEGRRLAALTELANTTDAFLSGYHAALLAGACFAGLGAVVSWARNHDNIEK